MLKKYLEYVNETFENDEVENNNDMSDDIELSDDENLSVEDPTDTDTDEMDLIDENPVLDIKSSSPTKILIINGCEPESALDKKTNELKTVLGGDCKEIHLYQLNIQPSKKQESKDGMFMVYDHIEEASAIIFACELIKGRMSDVMETAITRLKAHYTKQELSNKIFGAIIIGSEDKIKNTLVLTALNDFGMIVAGDCLSFSDNKSSFNVKKMASCLTNLCLSTQNLRDEEVESDIKSFDKFEKEDESDEEFVDSMKSDIPSFDENEEVVNDDDKTDNEVNDETTEDSEEDKNEDDSVTESFKLLNFDEFIK